MDLNRRLRLINTVFFGVPGLVLFSLGGFKRRLTYFLRVLTDRSISPNVTISNRYGSSFFDQLRNVGCIKLPDTFDVDASRFSTWFDKSKCRLVDLADVYDAKSQKVVSPADISRSIEDLRHHFAYIYFKDPLEQIEGLRDWIFDNRIMWDISRLIIGKTPVLDSVNFRLSFVNDLPARDTQQFHQDKNSFKVVKFFLYCTDVASESGPFQFIAGTHRGVPLKLKRSHRIPEHEVFKSYQSEDLISCVGNLGSMFCAVTNGIHRGLKPQSSDRILLTVTFTD